MEDLFDPNFYLELVNQAYSRELPHEMTMKAISGPNPRIAQRIQKFFEQEGICGGRFDTYRPAAYLLQKHLELRPKIDDSIIDRAASMFARVNSLLASNGSGKDDAGNGGNGKSGRETSTRPSSWAASNGSRRATTVARRQAMRPERFPAALR